MQHHSFIVLGRPLGWRLTLTTVALACACSDPASSDGGDSDASTSTAPTGSDTTAPSPDTGTTTAPGTEDSVTAGTTETPPDTTGDSTAGESTTGTTDDGTTDDGTTDDGTTDEGSSSTGEEPAQAPPWLVSLDEFNDGNHVTQIDIETAATLDVCVIDNTVSGQPLTGPIYSSTFTRDDRLLISRGNQLWEVELPSCDASPVGPFGFNDVFGISPDEGNDLFGLSAAADQLIRIDANTGMGTSVGPLGSDWFTLGVTWDEQGQRLLGLNGNDDDLYEIDVMTGMTTPIYMLMPDFFQIAFEYHTLTDQVYACTDDAHLLRVEDDGSLTDLGDLGLANGCLNLAAPWSDAAGLPPMP